MFREQSTGTFYDNGNIEDNKNKISAKTTKINQRDLKYLVFIYYYLVFIDTKH